MAKQITDSQLKSILDQAAKNATLAGREKSDVLNMLSANPLPYQNTASTPTKTPGKATMVESKGGGTKFSSVSAEDIETGGTTMVPTPKTFDTSKSNYAINSAIGNLSAKSFQDLTQEDILSAQGNIMTKAFDLIRGATKGKADRQLELTKEFGLEDSQKAVTDYKNQLEAEKRALDIAKRESFQDETLTKQQRNAKFAEMDRVSLQKQADLAILGNAAANDVQTSLALIDQRLQLEFGPQQEELDMFKQQLEFASPFLGELSGYLKDQADKKEKDLETQRTYTSDIMKLAIEASSKGQTSLANQLMSMAGQSNLTFEDVQKATQLGVSAGIYAPSGTNGDEEKQIADFQNDAADLIRELDEKKITWGTAFDWLKTRYPMASNELIDNILNKTKRYEYDVIE